jgi:hypothetical protein
MSAKQLASTVRQGLKISISVLDEDQIEGYLAGWDDDTLFVLAPDTMGFQKLLISRRNILFIHIQDRQTFMDEPSHKEMLAVLRTFKDYINNNFFARETSESAATSTTRLRKSPQR